MSDWLLLWAWVATFAAGVALMGWRRAQFWREYHRAQAARWRARAHDEETLREPPFLAPAFEKIEAGQLVVVRTDGKVALAAGGRTDGAA